MRKSSSSIIFALVCLVISSLVIAEPQPKQLHFVIKKFEVLGDNPLSESETRDVFEFFLGDHYGLEDLQEV